MMHPQELMPYVEAQRDRRLREAEEYRQGKQALASRKGAPLRSTVGLWSWVPDLSLIAAIASALR